jgi:hypothetical protein
MIPATSATYDVRRERDARRERRDCAFDKMIKNIWL